LRSLENPASGRLVDGLPGALELGADERLPGQREPEVATTREVSVCGHGMPSNADEMLFCGREIFSGIKDPEIDYAGELRVGCQHVARDLSSLLPLWEKVAREARRMRGLFLSVDLNPSPVTNALCASVPPSPTRGEGKGSVTRG